MGISRYLIITSLIFAQFSLTCANAEERPYYMWVDDDGVFNFSQMQPRNRVADEIPKPPKAPRPGGREPQSGESASQNQAAGSSSATAEDEDYIAQMEAVSSQGREVNCTLGRRTLQKLNQFRNIFMKGEDGLWRELTPERRATEVTKAERLIAENCPATQ